MKGGKCWERRARREEMTGSLHRARIMSGKAKKTSRNFEYSLDFDSIALICEYQNSMNGPKLEQMIYFTHDAQR